MVRVVEARDKIKITERQLEALQNFHKFTFTYVLRLEKYPIKFHPTNSKNNFYIAPLNKGKNSINLIY